MTGSLSPGEGFSIVLGVGFGQCAAQKRELVVDDAVGPQWVEQVEMTDRVAA